MVEVGFRNMASRPRQSRPNHAGALASSARFGYKIGNAMGNDPELTRAMVVGIGFSYKRKKK